MPRFVPVQDSEKPRDAYDDSLSNKHSAFNKSVQPTISTYHGIRDSGSQIKSNGNSKMIKNEKGLWVKDKSLDNEMKIDNDIHQNRSNERRRSRSRDKDYERRDVERRDYERRRSRSRDKDYESRYVERRDYERRRSRSRDRNRRRSHSRDRNRDRRRSHSRDRRIRSRDRHDRRRSRSNSRDRTKISVSKSPERNNKLDDKKEDKMKNESVDHDKFVNDHDEKDDSIYFKFNAIQVVNRFLDIYPMKQESRREEELKTLFAKDAKIFTLKSKNVLINGRDNIVSNLLTANKCVPNCTRRVFLEINGSVSYSYDFYPIGLSPGLGNPEKSCLLLYRVCNNVFTDIYGMVDTDNFSSKKNINSSDIFSSSAWKLAIDIVNNKENISFDMKNAIFHDYTNLEVWG